MNLYSIKIELKIRLRMAWHIIIGLPVIYKMVIDGYRANKTIRIYKNKKAIMYKCTFNSKYDK